MAETIELGTRVSEADIRKLRINQKVYLTGTIYTVIRPWHFTRSLDMLKKGCPLPMDLRDSFLGHCGLICKKNEDGTLDVTGIGPTTSSKFDEYTPELIKLAGIRGVIGKGGMDKATCDAMQEHGAVYLSMIGGCTATYTKGVHSVVDMHWQQQNWSENVFEVKVQHFGPLFVGIDANGNSVYEQAKARTEKTVAQIDRLFYK